jgi:hypothetical protein
MGFCKMFSSPGRFGIQGASRGTDQYLLQGGPGGHYRVRCDQQDQFQEHKAVDGGGGGVCFKL